MMSGVEIGIIGGTRGMGRWFARFLEQESCIVHVSGRQTGMSIQEMAGRCRVVVVSVPIGATTSVIHALGPHMSEESLLMDLTSLKEEPVKAMLASSVSEVIGCHPLFGPRIHSIAGKNIVLCPARGDQWLLWLRDIFVRHGAVVTETTPENHDRMMAIVQGLNHFNTATMGMALSRSGVDLAALKPFFTPAFHAKLKIIEKVLHQNPRLYAEIMTMNPGVALFIETYLKNVTELAESVYRKDSDAIADTLRTCTEKLDKKSEFFRR